MTDSFLIAPPKSDEELLSRAQQLAGLTLEQLATQLREPVPGKLHPVSLRNPCMLEKVCADVVLFPPALVELLSCTGGYEQNGFMPKFCRSDGCQEPWIVRVAGNGRSLDSGAAAHGAYGVQISRQESLRCIAVQILYLDMAHDI